MAEKSPEVLDLLVVGGGPAGTAAAFRATELGLSAQVVDYDDLMKRIRDYSKDKLILPGFGGGDKMSFPKGGDLIDALRFQPIDKDDMCAVWKGLYDTHGVPARVGMELTAIDDGPDGTLNARIWNHKERSEEEIAARFVVLAIGRGVPRRFDIPGNAEGIAYRLTDAEHYVGKPACVVGGGTSAAEAVIAISNAKAEAGDACAVYWSYRGDRMPRVSKALAEVFFEAYIGNGNIRYYPKSEPAAIVTAGDRLEYLSIRVDRRGLEGRPAETSHLEFAKDCCIACIGEDIPRDLLASMGIRMATGGPKNKTRMVVNRYLETQRPNVFLAGDLLSQAYFETDDFEADPGGFREVKHRGNIKSALRDGVLIAEVLRQRLDGKEEIEVAVGEAEELPAAEESSAGRSMAAMSQPVESAGPPTASVEPEREVASEEAHLVRILPTGVEEDEHPVRASGVTTLGSGDCDLSYPDDTMLSPQHASIVHGEDGYLIRDDGSSTGTFLKVAPARKMTLGAGELIRAGRQFLVLGADGDGPFFTHYDQAGQERGRHALTDKPQLVGRQAPDVILDADDTTLSRRHLALAAEGDKVVVKDLKSVNGTYLRVRAATPLQHGDQIRLGQQLFTFSLREGEPLDSGHEDEPAAGAPEDAPAAADGPTVAFKGAEQALSIAPGQSVCDVAEQAGLEITAECHSGICGSDPVRILSGIENVAGEAGEQERETLEELCELEPGECRLACMLKVKGPVEVEILKD